MGWPAWLCCGAAWSCAVLGGGEMATGQRGAGTSSNIFTLEVPRGDSRSLVLPLDPVKLKQVNKYDPETKNWKEQLLTGPGNSHSLMGKTASISLVDQNFTVWNASGTEEGFYEILQLIDGTCLAFVNVIVVDLPLPATVTPTFNASSNVTEPVNTSFPGQNRAVMCVVVSIVGVLIIGVF